MVSPILKEIPADLAPEYLGCAEAARERLSHMDPSIYPQSGSRSELVATHLEDMKIVQDMIVKFGEHVPSVAESAEEFLRSRDDESK